MTMNMIQYLQFVIFHLQVFSIATFFQNMSFYNPHINKTDIKNNSVLLRKARKRKYNT